MRSIGFGIPADQRDSAVPKPLTPLEFTKRTTVTVLSKSVNWHSARTLRCKRNITSNNRCWELRRLLRSVNEVSSKQHGTVRYKALRLWGDVLTMGRLMPVFSMDEEGPDKGVVKIGGKKVHTDYNLGS